ncbi:DUF6702 family protein [Aureitalea marina]|uniref:Peptidase E n=1 Tax=Aureitalea marina TaxID=930804 RepID=A0A2S7KTE1_9FLAO|nr:DUF6702 family protein [Aureitalea marina]PQB05909.1 hypothetical protein BST85_01620 [Aureitalea marina]
MKSKTIFLAFLILIAPVLISSRAHKFYVSITKVELSEEAKSVQIITKIFIDDIEATLQKRYDPNVSLDTKKETEAHVKLLEKYVLQKFKVEIDGVAYQLEYLGREYENDVVKCYLEVPGITDLNKIEIENSVLMDMFEEQQNIIHVKKGKTRKSLVLDKEHPKGMLNFD